MEIKEIVANLLNEAIAQRASDIYFLPVVEDYQVKFRNSEGLVHYANLKDALSRRIINYLKYVADMAISETRRPQVGAFEWTGETVKYSLRLSSVGNYKDQESLVIRIIYSLIEEKELFFNNQTITKLNELSLNRGMVVFAGPTGSGKTTTIYHLAKNRSHHQVVMSIEDPVEIKQPDFLQLQVNPEAQMNYSELIKVGLRHRPDVFIIGEIRDRQTAEAAVKASLSGHLVYATIHARSPLGVVSRLSQLGINDYYISQSVSAIAYQRLIPNCDDHNRALLVVHSLSELSDKHQYLWEEWQSELTRLVAQNKITQKTAEKFKAG